MKNPDDDTREHDGDPDPIDRTVERYRAELVAEADLARDDLDEIEDHLRSLTADLRASGMPAATAVTEAARRLGDPRELAREHARVSSPFGARISRARAWSAVALILPFSLWYAVQVIQSGRLVSAGGLETALATGLMLGIALRLSWARAFVLGTLPVSIAWMSAWSATWGGSRLMIAQIACYAGVLAFLVPWRRAELSRAGLGLALLGPAYAGAMTMLAFHITDPLGNPIETTVGLVATASILLGALGGMMRARWGAIANAVGAVALAVAATRIYPLEVHIEHPGAFRVIAVGSVVIGAFAAAASAALGWRHARSMTGTLRGLLI